MKFKFEVIKILFVIIILFTVGHFVSINSNDFVKKSEAATCLLRVCTPKILGQQLCFGCLLDTDDVKSAAGVAKKVAGKTLNETIDIINAASIAGINACVIIVEKNFPDTHRVELLKKYGCGTVGLPTPTLTPTRTPTPTPRGTSTGPTAIPAPRTCPADDSRYALAPNCGALGFDYSKFYTGSGSNRCCWDGSSGIETRIPTTPTNTPTPRPDGTGDGGGVVQPTPTPIPPPLTTKGFCADGNRQYDKPVNTPSCVINSTVYRQQFDSYCHNTYGSPSDFFYECLAANAPATASGYCANATATSNPISINNPTCGLANASYDSNYDDYCKEEYGSKDSQSNYFYKCPATTPTPPPTTTTTPTPKSSSCDSYAFGRYPVGCPCPSGGGCENGGCYPAAGGSMSDPLTFYCSAGSGTWCRETNSLVASAAQCNTSASTGCAAPNPSAPKTGYECGSTTYGGCGGGLTCQPATNSQKGCMCKGTGSSSPTATPTTKPVSATNTPIPTVVVDNCAPFGSIATCNQWCIDRGAKGCNPGCNGCY